MNWVSPLKVFFIITMFFFSSCDDGSFANAGRDEQKRLGSQFGQSSDSERVPLPNFTSRYDFKAEFDVLGLDLCSGEAEIKSFDDLSTKVLGEIPCKAGKNIDLGVTGSPKLIVPSPEIAKELPMYGYFTRTASSNDIHFNPPIVEMIAPIVNVAEDFEGKFSDEAITVSKMTDLGLTEPIKGRVVTKVNSIKPFEPKDYPEKFNSVIHWERKLKGFDKKVNFGDYGLYREIEYWIQPRPFVITKIVIRSKLRDLMSSTSGEGGASSPDLTSKLGFNVVITFHLKHHETH